MTKLEGSRGPDDNGGGPVERDGRGGCTEGELGTPPRQVRTIVSTVWTRSRVVTVP